jgi:carbon monoxide dehydrogenase subunit G
MATAPTRISFSIEIQSPLAEVWSRITDFERMPEWFSGVHRVRMLSGPPTRAGSERRLTLVHRGSHREQIAEWSPEKSFSIRVLDPPVFTRSWHAAIRFEPAGPGTRVRGEMEWHARLGLPGRIFDRFVVKPVVEAALRRSLRRLKRALEV